MQMWARVRRVFRRTACTNCREVNCECLPAFSGWVGQLMDPAVHVVERVRQIPAAVGRQIPRMQVQLPTWDREEIYSSI